VKVSGVEASVQHWSGLDKPVDLVLLFDVLIHVKRADRQALFQRLFTQLLAPNGVVIVITENYSPTCGLLLVMERLGHPLEVSYPEAEKDMLAAGFTLEYTQEIMGSQDFTNPSEDLIKFFQLCSHNKSTEQEVRAAIADVAGPNSQSDLSKKMGIFRKKPQ